MIRKFTDSETQSEQSQSFDSLQSKNKYTNKKQVIRLIAILCQAPESPVNLLRQQFTKYLSHNESPFNFKSYI